MYIWLFTIDKIINPKYDGIPKEIITHPHINRMKIYDGDSNTIYIAKEKCTFDKNIKGYDMFKYDEELNFTKNGMNRTCWNLPDIFKGLKITYHNENSWKEWYFKSACRGQEFVI